MARESFSPKYRRIFDDLMSKIERGVYPVGSQLPFERELCDMYAVERITVRKSLDMLVQAGKIEKRPGLGSFVKAPPAAVERPVSNTILFVMQKNQNDIRSNTSAFNAQLFFPIEQECSVHGYSLLYTGLTHSDDIGELVARYGIAGIFLVSKLPDEAIDCVAAMGIPAVCINHCDARLISVLPDNQSGVAMGIELLVSQGHRRIGFSQGAPDSINAKERFASYQMALYSHDLEMENALVMHGQWTYDGGRRAVEAMLASLPRAKWPTAIYAASDMMAIGAIDALKARGLTIPQDISVVGFDNIDMCKFCSPQLTTISTDPSLMAKVSLQHLLRLIDGGMTDADRYAIRLPVRLVRRESERAAGGQ